MCRINSNNRRNEAGSASVFVVIALLLVLSIASASALNLYRQSRAISDERTRLDENWQAKSAATVLDRIIQVKFPEQYGEDMMMARRCGEFNDALEPFDSPTLAPNASSPVAVVQPDSTEILCNNGLSGAHTSVFGQISHYLSNRKPILENFASDYGFDQNSVRVFSITEAVRRFSNGSDPAYQVHYIIDGRGGRSGKVRTEGDVVLGFLDQTCGTTATIEADRNTIQTGEQVALTISYSMAVNLKIYEINSNTLIHEATVTESPDLQTYSFTFFPASTNSYRVDATGSGSCSSSSGGVTVQVTPANACSTDPPLINSFSSSATTVAADEEFFLNWQTSGSVSEVDLDGVTVAPNNSNYRTRITQDTVFTLTALDSDPANDCPARQQVTVRVTNNSCSAVAPAVSFSADRTSVTTGESVNIGWNVAGLQSGGQVVFIEPDGTVRTIPPSGADTRVFNAPGTYTFKVKGSNFCPDGTEKTQEISVVITVTNSCAIPTINNFTVSPDTVYTGGNQNIIFNWNVSGQIDAQSIDQGIGAVNGSSHTIIQPQTTTTYTYAIVGCGQTRQAQTIVNVSPSPVCTTTSPNQPDATAGGGAAGSSSLPNDTSTNAFFRIMYWIKHFPDGTYKFNTQLYYTYEKPYGSAIIVPTFATLYVVEFGRLKVKYTYNQVEFWDGITNTMVASSPYESRLFSQAGSNPDRGYITVHLFGEDLNDGFAFPFPYFDMTNDVLKFNNFSTHAYTLPNNGSYPSTSLNVFVSGSLPPRWRCP